jgi:outer membrane protein OmpA-like peptidoglycan-associated protein/tetratricopeptide (TPR) repeat protein
MKQQLLNNLILILVCAFTSSILIAQEEQIKEVKVKNAKVKEATENFEQYAFVDARELYRKVADRGFTSPEVLKKLGDSYYLTADYQEAAKWYAQLLSTESSSETLDAEYYFRYAQTLKSMKRYDLADAQMEKFYALKGDDSRAAMFTKERDYLKEIEAQSGRYGVSQVFFNSGLQDFGPSFYGDRVVFSSNREKSTGDYIHDWNDQPFLDLFVVDNPRDSAPKVTKFSEEMNTPYHESTSVFTANGDVVYFTRNNYSKKNKGKKLRKDEAGTTKLKLFRSYKQSMGWSVPEELPFNSDEFSTAHPALSPDESTLYFASDRPGTKGLSDLWKTSINADGSFGDPINLGDAINTEGRETFPFVSEDGKLFYASDGHLGLGGLDIFVSQLGEDGKVGESYNVGKPVNSSADDFGLILNNEEGLGYFSSNRATGLGNDDIYSFTRKQKLLTSCAQNITGVTRDVKTDEILPLATVELRNIANEVVGTKTSDSAGRFSFPDVDCNTSYIVRASKPTYEPAEAIVNTGNEVGAVLNRDLYLKPPLNVELGDDLAKILNLNPIYFDFDKYNIRPDAALELEKVIAVMNEYPKLKIDVRSHTDSRAPDGYNMTLSQNRNVSTIRYIVEKGGISRSRLTGRGYGETQLTNACGNGIECNEEEHQLNRRSEFIIVEK